MPRPTYLPICDDRAEVERHRWPDDWSDGDTCHCGKFYLRHGTRDDGFGMELERTPRREE